MGAFSFSSLVLQTACVHEGTDWAPGACSSLPLRRNTGLGNICLRPIVERRWAWVACENKRSGVKRPTDRRADGSTGLLDCMRGELGQERGAGCEMLSSMLPRVGTETIIEDRPWPILRRETFGDGRCSC